MGTRSGGGRQKTVTVRLENYRERHEQPFGDFMNGDAPGRIVIFPNIQLVHPDGAEFYIYLTPASGGELRSERWQGRTELIPHNAPLLADAVELAERYADTQLSDLSLLIENPDRLAGQPRRVVIPLQ